jgi:hypothetical protein
VDGSNATRITVMNEGQLETIKIEETVSSKGKFKVKEEANCHVLQQQETISDGRRS